MRVSGSLLVSLRLYGSSRVVLRPNSKYLHRQPHTTLAKMDDEEMSMNNAAGPSRISSSRVTTTGGHAPDQQSTGVSKSAAKKAARKAHREATKSEFRARERAKQKEKKNALMQEFRAGTLDEEDRAKVEKRIELARLKRRQKAGADVAEEKVWKGGIVVDLGFDDLMTDREIASLSQQVAYVYASNRRASRPVSALLHTSVSPTASPQLWSSLIEKACSKWHRCSWWAESVDDLARVFGLEGSSDIRIQPIVTPSLSASPVGEGGPVIGKRKSEEIDAGSAEEDLLDGEAIAGTFHAAALEASMADSDSVVTPDQMAESSASRAKELSSALSGPNLPSAWSRDSHRLVYLSADAEEELSTLKEDEIYIVGGLVDKNRYKLLCENKARSLGIRTARLPIGSYIADLPTRKVLTVNQTFDILLKYIELNNWAKAFHAVIPQRKFATVGKKALLKQRSKARAELDPARGNAQVPVTRDA